MTFAKLRKRVARRRLVAIEWQMWRAYLSTETTAMDIIRLRATRTFYQIQYDYQKNILA